MTHRPDDEKAAELAAEKYENEVIGRVNPVAKCDYRIGFRDACAHKNAETKELVEVLDKLISSFGYVNIGRHDEPKRIEIRVSEIAVNDAKRVLAKHQADAEVKS